MQACMQQGFLERESPGYEAAQRAVQSANNDERRHKGHHNPKKNPTNPATKTKATLSRAARAARRYRTRDAAAALLHPKLKQQSKRKKKSKKKKKRECLTDKQRRAWAKAYYEQHHTSNDSITWSPPAIEGHLHPTQRGTPFNTTMTKIPAKELLELLPSQP